MIRSKPVYQTYPPTTDLAPHIECFWRWKTEGQEEQSQLILPDASPELIVHLAALPEARSGRQWKIQPRAFLYCAADRCLDLRIRRPMDVFAVRFRPWGLSRFSARPMSEMLDQPVLPGDGLGELGEALVDAIRTEQQDRDRVNNLDRLLGAKLKAHVEKAKSIEILIEALDDPGKPAPSMAKRLARSSRTVRRVWRELVGISPRSYAKLMRAHEALSLIEQGKALAWVAMECGYSDQAHMARQIREVVGLPPSRLKTLLGMQVYRDLYAQRPSAPWKQ